MVARDLGTKNVTTPTRGAEEPHIGSVNRAEPKPKIVQTGYSRGGTSNPAEGESGDVEIVVTDSTGSDIAGHDQGSVKGSDGKGKSSKKSKEDDKS